MHSVSSKSDMLGLIGQRIASNAAAYDEFMARYLFTIPRHICVRDVYNVVQYMLKELQLNERHDQPVLQKCRQIKTFNT